ncbi:MAG: hypothetical protein ACJ77A_14970 [Actinomycetota bacterium]
MSSQTPPPPPGGIPPGPPPPPPGGGYPPRGPVPPPGGYPPGGYPPGPGAPPPGQGWPPAGGPPPGGYSGYGQMSSGPVRGHRGGRLGRGILIGVFAAVLAIVLGVAAVLITSSAPPAPKSDCPKPPCGQPPEPPKGSLAPALVAGTQFVSPGGGYQLEFDPKLWTITDQNRTDVDFHVQNPNVTVIVQIRAQPADQATPEDALNARLDALGGDILGLAKVTKPSEELLGPAVGYQRGIGQALSGVTDTPQGPGSPVAVIVTAATDGTTTVTFTLITDQAIRKAAFTVTDTLMNTFRFPSEVPS